MDRPPAMRRWVRWAIAIGLLGGLVASAAPRWDALTIHVQAFDWRWGGVSLLGLMAAYVLGVEGWRRWVTGLGTPLPYREAFRIVFQANMAKYLPGGAWQYVGRVALCARVGVPVQVTVASMAMETLMMLATAALIGVPLLASGGGALSSEFAQWLVLGGLAGLGVLHPAVLERVLGVGARLLRRTPVAVPFRYGFVLAMACLYLAYWVVLGLAFTAFCQAWSLRPLDPAQGAILVGALALAWAVGTVAVVAPAGLGVREASLAALIAPSFPAGWPALVAVASRLWFMAADLIVFLLVSRTEKSGPDSGH